MNKRKLNAIMQLHGESQQDLARYLQLSLSRLNAKINEYRGAQFRQNEIAAIQEQPERRPDRDARIRRHDSLALVLGTHLQLA